MVRIKATPVQNEDDTISYLPLDFVKEFEDQIMKNHHQSVERIAERYGLSWRELAHNIRGGSFEDVIKVPESACKQYVLQKLYKWFTEKCYKNGYYLLDNLIAVNPLK